MSGMSKLSKSQIADGDSSGKSKKRRQSKRKRSIDDSKEERPNRFKKEDLRKPQPDYKRSKTKINVKRFDLESPKESVVSSDGVGVSSLGSDGGLNRNEMIMGAKPLGFRKSVTKKLVPVLNFEQVDGADSAKKSVNIHVEDVEDKMNSSERRDKVASLRETIKTAVKPG